MMSARVHSKHPGSARRMRLVSSRRGSSRDSKSNLHAAHSTQRSKNDENLDAMEYIHLQSRKGAAYATQRIKNDENLDAMEYIHSQSRKGVA